VLEPDLAAQGSRRGSGTMSSSGAEALPGPPSSAAGHRLGTSGSMASGSEVRRDACTCMQAMCAYISLRLCVCMCVCLRVCVLRWTPGCRFTGGDAKRGMRTEKGMGASAMPTPPPAPHACRLILLLLMMILLLLLCCAGVQQELANHRRSAPRIREHRAQHRRVGATPSKHQQRRGIPAPLVGHGRCQRQRQRHRQR